MKFLIDTLEGGEPLLATLEDVGAVYPDDDVIYFFGIPCRLSSARPTMLALDGRSTARTGRVGSLVHPKVLTKL